MFKRFALSFIMFCCSANCLANATALIKQVDDSALSVQELTMPAIESPIQANAIFVAMPEHEFWIKNALGNDFYQFFTKKIINKKPKANSLKMDFNLGTLFQATTKADESNNSYVEINKTRIKTLDVPVIQFSDETYTWNAANLSLVKLGNDYQQFVNDEVLAGNTYKEFWDGVETTAFEDFVDEHFGFHDSALFRYLILLAGILLVISGYLLKPKLMQYLYPD
ncbi:MAG: hypothetical protein V4545_06075 [Pseudomonadota bacterium]